MHENEPLINMLCGLHRGSPSIKKRHKLRRHSAAMAILQAGGGWEEAMAKGQMRSSKEAKKPKAADKKDKKVPSYMANDVSVSRPAPGKAAPKK